MPNTTSLVYAGPVDEVIVTDAAANLDLTVTRGVPFEVPASVAGEAATYDGDVLLSLGSGILANPDFHVATDEEAQIAGADFDPTSHTVAEVEAYLAGLPDDPAGNTERDRVIAAEKAGKNRTSITG